MALKDRLKELKDLGFDDDVIIMTLGISKDEFNRLNGLLELERRRIEKRRNETIQKPQESERSSQRKSKLQLVRERYFRLYNTDNSIKVEKGPSLTRKEYERINSLLDGIKPDMDKLLNVETPGYSEISKSVSRRLTEVRKRQLPLDLAEKAYLLFPSEANLKKVETAKTLPMLKKNKSLFKNDYIRLFDNIIVNEDSVEELEKILRRVNSVLGEDSASSVISTIQTRIRMRIQTLRSTIVRDDLSTYTTEGLEKIASMMVGTDYDEEKVNELLAQEESAYLKKKEDEINNSSLKSGLKKSMMPRKEGIRNNINYFVGRIIREHRTIGDAQEILERLVKMNGKEDVSLSIVLENLIANSRFNEAESLVRKVYKVGDDPIRNRARKQAYSKVKMSEVADFIRRGIYAKPTSYEEENSYYQMIEDGIRRSAIEPAAIAVGKTQDGLRTIYWKDLIEKTRER